MGVTSLLLVRHGESTANVAASAAEAAGAEVVDAPLPDPDVPLTVVGVDQALAVGEWLRSLPGDAFPTAVWCSPYLRATETARLAVLEQRSEIRLRRDERLRDRELGILDTLTHIGVRARFPQEFARRNRLGKFYYRPPGGESWADVALRLRMLLADLDRLGEEQRIMVVAHDAVITLVRYILAGVSEQEILRVAHTTPLLNASISRLVRPSGEGSWAVDFYNSTEHLRRSGTLVTKHAGDPDESKN
ncbi:MAG: phosphoglycerate mutase family protein [Homoserinimonas sp.]|nr:phosphoglycerate mutase family protein [Homoserinimonas sp.]